MFYYAFIETPKDDNQAWGVVIPDVAGCFSASDKGLDDAIENATQALSLHLDGETSLPKAHSLEAILKDPENDCLKGMTPVLVPALTHIGKTKRVSISMDQGIYELLAKTAKVRGATFSGFLVDSALAKVPFKNDVVG